MIRFIAFIDTFDLAASLVPRIGEFDHETRLLELRGAPLSRWPEAKRVLSTIKRGGKALWPEGVAFGRVFFEMLDPGSVQQWQQGCYDAAYAEAHLRLMLAVRTNPAAMLFVGTQAHHLLPGHLAAVPLTLYRSAVNFGEIPRIHLVADVRREADAPQARRNQGP